MMKVLRYLVPLLLSAVLLPLPATAQDSISLGKRLDANEITAALGNGPIDGYSYVTTDPFQLALNPNGTAVFSANGADDTRAKWAIDAGMLCFLYDGTNSWSCRLIYTTSDGAGMILVEQRDNGLVALSQLVPQDQTAVTPQPAPRTTQPTGQACAFDTAQPMTRADLSEYLNDKSYEGFVWGNSGQVYSTQQNLARVDERRAVIRIRALGRGFEGDSFINNDTGQLCQFMCRPDYTLMTCFDALHLSAACPFDIALLDADTGQLVSAYFPPVPLSQAPPIAVYESQQTVVTPPSNAAEWFATGIALAVIWDQLFADTSKPVDIDSLPQSTCEQTVANRTLFCSERAEYGSTSTNYILECDGSRRENQICRGRVRPEGPIGGIGEDYFCDPVTVTRGPTRQSVFTQLCQ